MQVSPLHEGFPRIGDYAFLSNCQTAALVAPDSSVEWLCVPRFDSPSVCAAILDRGAGALRFGPETRTPVARAYEPGTNVLETTWSTPGGWLRVRDALVTGAGAVESGPGAASAGGAGAQGDSAGQSLVRVAECIHGEVEVILDCELRPDYARADPRWGLASDRRSAELSGSQPLRLDGDLDLGIEAERVVARQRLRAGERCFCALGWGGEPSSPRSIADAERSLEACARFWRGWLDGGEFPDHPWRIYLQRSALTLKGLIYSPTGASVAAPTTSLPETPGGERNWDYRYTWIRDATFTLWGLHVLGFDYEADGFADFLGGICQARGTDLQIMYGIDGEAELPERELGHLSGYEGARPVRIGNAAHTQRQNDVHGALLDSLYIHAKARGHIPERRRLIVEVARAQVQSAAAVWRQPDQGIWEVRGAPRHYVSSKLMCWVALERGARLARRFGSTDSADRWQRIAEEIREDILERGVSERGVFRQHYETDALDASTLLVPLVRFLPPEDERVRATVLAIAEELTEDGLVLRYRVEETDDGLSGEEGTFTICSFWLVSALSEIGEAERARALCERLIGLASPLGHYAEEIDSRSGCQLGNFPQAFTHLSLVNAVSHVIADERAGERIEPSAVFGEMRAAG